MPEFQKLQVILGYHFNDLSLLTRAITHRSCNRGHNERLEFLGDALLGFLIARRIYQLYPDLNEGDLTRIRSTLVNKEALAITARDIGIGDHLYLGLGEENSGGRDRDSVLADAVEAIIGAVYLDGGVDACSGFVNRLVGQDPCGHSGRKNNRDPKTELQEFQQGSGKPLPKYLVLSVDGAAHEQVFRVECVITGPSGSFFGKGSTKRAAEQMAASMALKNLKEKG